MLSVVNMLPRLRQRQTIARLTVSALVASLPLLYVSLLRPPPAALARDTAFWFLMSNCVVAAIVAADDASALFFGPKADPCDNGGGVRDGHPYVVVSGDHQLVAAVDGSCGAVVPEAATHDEPTTVETWGGRVQQEEAVSMTTSSNSMDRASLPSLIKGGEENHDDAAASKPGTAMNHASVLHRVEQDKVVIEPTSTDTNNAVIVASQEEEVDGDELEVVKANVSLAEPEPEPRPRLVASKNLVEEEEEAVEEWRFCRTADLLQDASAGAARGGKLRRSATEGCKPAEEESEYWELSDEELNRRVEDFIARFNREMRLQVEQEAAVVIN